MTKTKRFLVLVATLAMFAGSSAWAAQYARPDSTASTGTWTPVNAGTHHDAINDADNSDYIDSGVGNNSTIIVTLSNVVDPGTYASDHIIRYSCQATVGNKPKGGEGCDVALYQGNTLIATATANATRGAFGVEQYVIPDASAITDYGNLEFRITSSSLDTDESIQVGWAELELPDAAVTAPTVTSPTFTDVTDTTATLGGNVTNDNGTPVTDRGVEWGTSPGGPYPNNVPEGVGGTGIFTVPVTGLPSSTTIYFRAWAFNGVTGYSGENSFPTDAPAAAPTVTVDTPTNVGQNSATLGGNVTDDGGASVTVRGIVWNTTSPAESGGTVVPMGSGLGAFSQLVSGLPAGTLIYVKAYATNSAGTSYSSVEEQFTTQAGLATVATRAVENITATTADLGGDVTGDGGAAVTERGIVWDTANPPETAGTVVPMGSGTGPFVNTVGSLPTGQVVYFKAYAVNSEGTAYSAVQNFTPAGPPLVTATPATGITLNSATLGGDITNDGGSAVTARGIVWDTVSPPEAGGTVVPMGSGLGSFSQLVGSLPAATTIYWKAYGANSVATGYSGLEQFDTLSEPTVQASNLNFATVAGRSVRMTWTRGNGDGVIVVMRLQATGKTDPQDGDDYTANPDFPSAPELPVNSQNYVVYKGPLTAITVTGLTMTTDYSVAVYEYAGAAVNTDYLLTLPAEGDVTTTDYAVHNYDWGVDCDDCHNHGTFGARGTELKAVCETCHNSLGQAAAKLEFDNHLTPNKNPGIDHVDCGVCHELHNLSATNTTEAYNSITLQTQHNKSFLRANVDKYIPSAAPPAFLHNDTPKREDPHPDAPQAADTPERAVEGGNDTTSRGYCQVCHTMTNYHTNNPSVSLSDQCHDGESGNCGPAETQCGDCHEHNNKFIGVGGSQTCIECHDSVQGSRAIVTTQFDRFSTHVPGGSSVILEADCLVCHNQGGHTGGAVSVWNADDGSTAYTQPTSGASTLATGEGEAFAPHCLSCHDSNGAGYLPGSGDQTPSSPFFGSGAPPVIDATVWSNAAHNIPTPSSTPMTCVGDGANGCHASGHGSENNALLAPAGGPAQSATDFCYNCHDSDGPSTFDIQSEFAGWTHATVTSQSGAPADQKHDLSAASCADCHSVHVDSSTNPVADPDTGLPLATYSPSNSYTDDGHNIAYDAGGNLDPINPEGSGGGYSEPDYIQFCLTCHDGTAPPGVTLPGNMINMATAWAADQHGAAEGSTGSRTGKGGLKFPYVTSADEAADNDPTAAYAAMNCNTCHGAHGSPSIFNLRESITVGGVVMTVGGAAGFLDEPAYNGSSTYTLPLIGGNQADHYWGAWCTFCHKGDAHPGKVEADACTGGHMHNGGSF